MNYVAAFPIIVSQLNPHQCSRTKMVFFLLRTPFLSQLADSTANVSHFHRLAVAFVYDQHCCVGVK